MTAARLVSAAFGLMMVAAASVGTERPALIAALIAGVAVLVGLFVRPAATAAVLASVCAIAVSEPQPLLAALSGLSAAAYLVLAYTTITRPTAVALVGFTAAGLLAVAIPTGVSWLPLLAPIAAVLLFAAAMHPFFGQPAETGLATTTSGATTSE